jgi:protein-L-isoaspartate(D-aspartate) O-methyltransferase
MPVDFARARDIMVDSQVRTADVTDPLIQKAMRTVPRERYCGSSGHLAYADAEVSYAPGYWLLRPRDIGKLLQGLRPRPGEKALAISAPYGAAVLAQMGLEVETADNPAAVSGVYDVVICEGAVAQTPDAWLNLLAPGGRLGVVERSGPIGRAKVYSRSDEGVGGRTLFDSAAQMLPGFEPAPHFAF